MEFCRDGSVIYAPHEHDKAQRAIACVQELRAKNNGKSTTKVDKKVTGFNTNNKAEATVEGGK